MSEQSILTPTEAASHPAAGTSYLEWGAIFGGSMLAGAMSVVLLQFGAGIGLSLGSPTLPDGSVSWNVLVAGLWVVTVAIASSAAGGYIAGRMRSRRNDAVETEVGFRDGAHGLVVWAVATLLTGLFIVAVSSLSAIGAAATTNETSVETTADMLRIGGNIASIFAFTTAAGSAIGAATAWFAAVSGGKHRDTNLSLDGIVPRPFRKA